MFRGTRLAKQPYLFTSVNGYSTPYIGHVRTSRRQQLYRRLINIVAKQLKQPCVTRLAHSVGRTDTRLRFRGTTQLHSRVRVLRAIIRRGTIIFSRSISTSIFNFTDSRLRTSIRTFCIHTNSVHNRHG